MPPAAAWRRSRRRRRRGTPTSARPPRPRATPLLTRYGGQVPPTATIAARLPPCFRARSTAPQAPAPGRGPRRSSRAPRAPRRRRPRRSRIWVIACELPCAPAMAAPGRGRRRSSRAPLVPDAAGLCDRGAVGIVRGVPTPERPAGRRRFVRPRRPRAPRHRRPRRSRRGYHVFPGEVSQQARPAPGRRAGSSRAPATSASTPPAARSRIWQRHCVRASTTRRRRLLAGGRRSSRAPLAAMPPASAMRRGWHCRGEHRHAQRPAPGRRPRRVTSATSASTIVARFLGLIKLKMCA